MNVTASTCNYTVVCCGTYSSRKVICCSLSAFNQDSALIPLISGSVRCRYRQFNCITCINYLQCSRLSSNLCASIQRYNCILRSNRCISRTSLAVCYLNIICTCALNRVRSSVSTNFSICLALLIPCIVERTAIRNRINANSQSRLVAYAICTTYRLSIDNRSLSRSGELSRHLNISITHRIVISCVTDLVFANVPTDKQLSCRNITRIYSRQRNGFTVYCMDSSNRTTIYKGNVMGLSKYHLIELDICIIPLCLLFTLCIYLCGKSDRSCRNINRVS